MRPPSARGSGRRSVRRAYLASLDDQAGREQGFGRSSTGIMRARAVDAAL